MPRTVEERLATLEAEQLADLRQQEAILREFDKLGRKLGTIDADIQGIKQTLGRQKGFVTGAATVATIVWTVLAGCAAYIWRLIDK